MLLGGIGVFSLILAVVIGLGNAWWVYPLVFVGAYLGLFLLAVLFLWVVCLFVDLSKERTEDSRFYRALAYLYIDAAIKVAGLKVTTQGLEQIPKAGRFLLVCNHLCEADPGVLHSYFKKSQLAFISKRENLTMPIINKMMHATLCQMINRENDREALKTILKCIQLIREDKVSIAVFPEGYINEDRKLHRFRSGVFKIAQKTGVPIVVCTIRGTEKVFYNLAHLKPTPVALHLLTVIPGEDVAASKTVDLADRIYHMMAEDLGPERVAQE